MCEDVHTSWTACTVSTKRSLAPTCDFRMDSQLAYTSAEATKSLTLPHARVVTYQTHGEGQKW